MCPGRCGSGAPRARVGRWGRTFCNPPLDSSIGQGGRRRTGELPLPPGRPAERGTQPLRTRYDGKPGLSEPLSPGRHPAAPRTLRSPVPHLGQRPPVLGAVGALPVTRHPAARRLLTRTGRERAADARAIASTFRSTAMLSPRRRSTSASGNIGTAVIGENDLDQGMRVLTRFSYSGRALRWAGTAGRTWLPPSAHPGRLAPVPVRLLTVRVEFGVPPGRFHQQPGPVDSDHDPLQNSGHRLLRGVVLLGGHGLALSAGSVPDVPSDDILSKRLDHGHEVRHEVSSLQSGDGVLVDIVSVVPGAGVRISLRPELAAP